MVGVNRYAAGLTFLLLAVIATMFPPFHWGEEQLQQLQTERERLSFRGFHPDLYDRLPIKSYSFLFGPSSRAFLEWTWDGRRSVQTPFVLRRRLVPSELVLEYVLCALVALSVGVGVSARSGRTIRQASEPSLVGMTFQSRDMSVRDSRVADPSTHRVIFSPSQF